MPLNFGAAVDALVRFVSMDLSLISGIHSWFYDRAMDGASVKIIQV